LYNSGEEAVVEELLLPTQTVRDLVELEVSIHERLLLV
jgi:hypothetical protein